MKDLEKNRAYRREYDLNRYYKIREEARNLLGGRCAECGSLENLEFDHIDPKAKRIELSKQWGIDKIKWKKELSQKCQLLCHSCHKYKSDNEQTTREHGSHAMFRRGKCRCEICIAFNKEYMKQFVGPGKRKTCFKCKKRVYSWTIVSEKYICSKCI